MAVRIGKIGTGHAHAVGRTNAPRESLEVEFVGIFEPDPETIAVRSQDPAYGGVRWLSEDELPIDRSVQAVFVETRPADNLGFAALAMTGQSVLAGKPSDEAITHSYFGAQCKGIRTGQLRFSGEFPSRLSTANLLFAASLDSCNLNDASRESSLIVKADRS